jgi:hypothetical protein
MMTTKTRTSGKRGTGLKQQKSDTNSPANPRANQSAFNSYEASKSTLANAGLSPAEYEAEIKRLAKLRGV